LLDVSIILSREPFSKKPDVITWAKNNLYISRNQGTANEGFYDVSVTPYMAEPLQKMCDEETRRVVLMTGAQVGKTQAECVAMAYRLLFEPSPMMLVMPAKEEAQEYSETRLKPTLTDSPALQCLIPQDRRKNFGKANMHLNGSLVHIRGAGSASQLASVPVRTMVLDETDKYPVTFTREGSPITLIEQRMKTYAGREKMIMASTPTIESGTINQQFLLGDRREYWIPCPKCGNRQPITFKDVTFANDENALPATISKSARLKCRACGYLMTTSQKNEAVKRGEWLAMCDASRAGFVSYHLQSIASPWVSLEYLVEAFITAKRKGANDIQTFVNSELAEPWKEEGEGLQGTRLQALEADYEEGGHFVNNDEISTRARFAGVDVQKDYLVLVIREFALGGASGLVLARRISGFVELDELCEEYGVTLCCIDARFRTDEVVSACVNFADMLPCYGRTKFTDGAMWSTREQNVAGGVGGNIEKTVTHIFYDQSTVFEYVAEGLRGDRVWQLFKGATLDPIYCAEVTAKSKVAGIWQAPPSTADHYADAEKLAMLGAILSQYMLPMNLE
jgi:phage terminase large subunit GpA-like protein